MGACELPLFLPNVITGLFLVLTQDYLAFLIHSNSFSCEQDNKMSDEEFFMVFIFIYFLLKRSQQRRMQRMILLLSEYVQLSNLQVQQAALRYFMQQYSESEAPSFHRYYNDFDVHFSSDLNTSKDLHLDYWQKHFRMRRRKSAISM